MSPNATIHTDEAKYYGLVSRESWGHCFVNHSAKEYARPDHLCGGGETIHVNGVENCWGHFTKAVAGTHIHISNKHAPKYVGEFTYRANHLSTVRRADAALLLGDKLVYRPSRLAARRLIFLVFIEPGCLEFDGPSPTC